MRSKREKERNKDKILNQIPIFLAKTYRIVDNPAYKDTISWNPEGNGFVVKNVTDLTENIFPKHFKHTNYASFVRQLNLYGFHKVRSSEDGQIFTHASFLRDDPDLLPLIKRKNAPQPDSAEKHEQLVLRNDASQMVLPYDPSRDQHYQKELTTLTEKHDGLQNLVSVLVEQNKEIIMQNKGFIEKLNKVDDNYRTKLETLIFLMVFGLKGGENNIIVPAQLSNMIKAFTSKGTKKNKKKAPSSDSQAVQLFDKSKQGRFNNKGIEEILQMLKMEGDGDAEPSERQQQQKQQHAGQHDSSFHLGEDSVHGLTPQHTPVMSPMPSLHSLPSHYAPERVDDWDFLAKLDQSDLDLDEGSHHH